jgi:hypothetical protein
VPTGVVVGSILLAADQELGVEELTVVACPDLVDGRRVQVDKDGSGDIFAIARLGEEGLVGASIANVLRVGIGTTVTTKAVFEQIPVGRCQI